MLAWMRLLVDPQDAAAVVRALARPPIELRQVDLARVIQVARRRKLDLVRRAERRDRVAAGAARGARTHPALRRAAPQRGRRARQPSSRTCSSARLIDRLGVRGAGRCSRPRTPPTQQREPRSALRELARRASSPQRPGAEHARAGPPPRRRVGAPRTAIATDAAAERRRRRAGAAGTREPAPASRTLQLLREEVLDGVARIGGRLGELRLDTDLDISHGVVRYLELLKLSALLQRPAGRAWRRRWRTSTRACSRPPRRCSGRSSRPRRSTRRCSPQRREEHARAGDRARARSTRSSPFLPRKGVGLALSASDIETYRSCPLRYKFARVLRIPSEQTIHQRFGIVVHQVLERYHSEGADRRSSRCSSCSTPAGAGAASAKASASSSCCEKARAALTRYHARLDDEDVASRSGSSARSPSGSGRITCAGASTASIASADGAEQRYELIDYKTSRPKTRRAAARRRAALAVRARGARGLAAGVLPPGLLLRARRPQGARSRGASATPSAVKDIVLEVGEGILAQAFEPTPSPAACSICDYRIVCPAAEG